MDTPVLQTMVGFVMTTHPESALRFYQNVLGFRLLSDDPFALAFDANGCMLRIGKTQHFTPVNNTILGWKVDDIEAAVQSLSAQGVEFEHYPKMNPDQRGIVTFPSGDRVAWFKDPEGNVLSISEHRSVVLQQAA